MKVTKWILPQMTKEALKEALKSHRAGSEIHRAIKAELESRKDNRPATIEDYL